MKIKRKVRAPKARPNLLERQSVFRWTPRSRAGSFIRSEGLGKGQLDLAPGWTGSYENQMTIMIITRIRFHLVFTEASRNS